MAGQDNRLGAPTEGLGQTVTFAAGGSGGVPQTGAGQQGQLRAGIQGSGMARNTAGPITLNPVKNNEILNTLNKLGQEIMKPKIEAARNAAYVSGMQRVASGEAIKEIVDEQPWYSKIFGDTPAIEGARAYTGFAKAQAIVSEIDADMPNLREISPQSFKQLMTDRLNTISTGDPDTDVMVAQSLIKEMPTIMKRHTKEHIGWQQDNLAKTQQAAQVAAANSLTATLSKFNSSQSVDDLASGEPLGSTLDAGDVVEKQIVFANTFAPLPGVPLETSQKLSTATISNLLSQRNLHAFYTLEDAGVIDGLGEDNARRLRDKADRVEARARAEMPESLSNDFATVKALVSAYDRKGVEEELVKRISKLNSDYKALTGAREPIISGRSRAELIGDLMSRQVNARRTIEAAWDRRNAAGSGSDGVSYGGSASRAQEEETAVVGTITKMVDGEHIKNLPKALRDKTWSVLHRLPAEQQYLLHSARINQFQQGTIDTEGQGYIRSRAQIAQAGSSAADWDNLYRTEWLPLITRDGSERVALGYFGEEFGRKMHAYSGFAPAAGDVNATVAAFTQAVKLGDQQPPLPSGDRGADILKAVKDVAKNDNQSGGWFTSDSLNEEDQLSVAREVSRAVENMPGVDLEDAVAAQVSGMRARGVEFAAGFKWDTGGGPRVADSLDAYSIAQKSDIGAPRLNDAIKSSINGRAKELGIDSPRPTYVLDDRGNPTLRVIGYNKASKLISFSLTVPEIHDMWVKDKESKRGLLNLNLELKPMPEEYRKNYATEAEWIAYEKRQAARAAKKTK